MEAIKGHIEISIPVILFRDEEERIWYAHCPTLDITGYGESQEDAATSFKIMLRETIEYMVTHGTLDKELRRLGWKKTKNGQVPPSMENMLQENKELRRMFALPHTLQYQALNTIQ